MEIKNVYGDVILTLRGADLSEADLRGVDLRRADLRGVDLRGANLSEANLSGADLSGANLSGADLSEANLSEANLRRADLRRADLRRANLSEADLHNAKLPTVYVVPRLFTKMQEQISSARGALNMDEWHYCETTHCVAGWATTLAGGAGLSVENLIDTNAAAALIITQSCPYLHGKVPDFYSDNETALRFIAECAEKEKQLEEQ